MYAIYMVMITQSVLTYIQYIVIYVIFSEHKYCMLHVKPRITQLHDANQQLVTTCTDYAIHVVTCRNDNTYTHAILTSIHSLPCSLLYRYTDSNKCSQESWGQHAFTLYPIFPVYKHITKLFSYIAHIKYIYGNM